VILADTSAWIEFRRATGSAVHLRLRTAVETGESLVTTGVVVMELLAGARDEQDAEALRRLLARCRFLPLEEPWDDEVAASIYRACRREGATVRRMTDCLIAAVAIRCGARVLNRDIDFDVIARHSALVLEPA
jgi:predicted nucleic acid-binding protein